MLKVTSGMSGIFLHSTTAWLEEMKDRVSQIVIKPASICSCVWWSARATCTIRNFFASMSKLDTESLIEFD